MTTYNPSDKSADITLSGGNLIATHASGGSFANVRSTTSKTSGKYYFEVTWSGGDGNNGVGVANGSASLSNYLGNDANSIGWYDTGFGHPSGTTFTAGDVIGIAIDCTNGLIWYRKNGTFSGNPAAGTGGTSISLAAYYAAVAFQYSTLGAGTINFGGSAFANSPPSGFSAWDAGAATNYTLTASVGSFTLSGQAAALKRGLKITAAVGAFTFTGQAATLSKGYRLTAAVGTFTLSGQAAGLRRASKVTAAVGSFTLTGQAAGLNPGKRLTASTGSFALTGQAAGFTRALKIIAGTGSFTLSGQAAGTKAARKVFASLGTFALTGQAANLVVAGPQARVLSANAGSFILNGQSVSLIVGGADAIYVGARSSSQLLVGVRPISSVYVGAKSFF